MLEIKELLVAENEEEIEDILVSNLSGADYGTGELEELSSTNYKLQQVLARLIINLKKKQVINDEDIVELFKYIF